MFAFLIIVGFYIKSSFSDNYNSMKNNTQRMFVKSADDVFNRAGLLFRDILYNIKGRKKYFLVRNIQGKWIIINNRLKVYGKYKFDELINEKEGVFLMKADKEEFYLYINGEKPRINIRLNQ